MIKIAMYSDALCVWAYISQIRIAELEQNFPGEVAIDYRFMPVFGDVAGKMAAQWGDRGGLGGYAAHVQEIAAEHEHIAVHPRCWLDNTPASSLPAHLLLCGVKAMHAADPQQTDADAVPALLRAIRRGFFADLLDVSRQDTLLNIAADTGIDMGGLEKVMRSGQAHAAMAADILAARDGDVRFSPTLVLNEGRQVLAGNVGYRVIEANIREQLNNPGQQQSWC